MLKNFDCNYEKDYDCDYGKKNDGYNKCKKQCCGTNIEITNTLKCDSKGSCKKDKKKKFDFIDCCVYPLKYVLEQLIGEFVILPTVADIPNNPPQLFFVTIIAVDDCLVTVTDGETIWYVSIADLLGVGFLMDTSVSLLPPDNIKCKCFPCEKPLRGLFNSLIGTTVDLRLSQGYTLNGFTPIATGLGTVYGLLPLGSDITINAVFSLCQIVQVSLTPNDVVPENSLFSSNRWRELEQENN